MTEAKNNDLLGSIFRGGHSNILLILAVLFLFGHGGKGHGGWFGKIDENLLLIFVLIILLFSGSGGLIF